MGPGPACLGRRRADGIAEAVLYLVGAEWVYACVWCIFWGTWMGACWEAWPGDSVGVGREGMALSF